MVNQSILHGDDEPLLPLTNYNHGHSKDSSQPPYGDNVKSSKLSGSTAHDSISSSSSVQEGMGRDHKQHSHDDESKNEHDYRLSASSDEFESDDEESILLEAHKASERDKRRLKIAIGLCSTFFVVELLGGLWSESLALLSDSFHLLTDITSFIISLTAIYLSQRPSTATHTFGFHRAEVLGALFSIFLIWALTALLVIEAYDRVRHPIDVDGKTMSIVAGLGVFVNITLMFVLGGHHHHHGDDHDHEHSDNELGHTHVPLQNVDDNDHLGSHKSTHTGKEHHHHHKNLNITAATLHVLGDLLSSIGVLISSLIITFHPTLTFLDPICTFIFSIMVIATTVGVFKRSIGILMERAPTGMDTEEIKESICDIPGILEVKSLNVWSLTIGHVALAGSVYLQPEIKDLRKAASIVAKARRMLKSRYKIRECTIQVELYTSRANLPHHRRHHHQESTTLSSSSTISTRVSVPEDSKFGNSRHSMDALARHDQDIIFSIGDEDLEDTSSPRPTKASNQFDQIIRAGTPLSEYRKNRNVSEDNESESEMEQETPLQVTSGRWV
ncbi:hypothetical protein BGZ49_003727 [Haplosporangium sp. Z 27]|nr:hypothetical protein BGZ49_003727 [Haplosporangium sp. Z 27]